MPRIIRKLVAATDFFSGQWPALQHYIGNLFSFRESGGKVVHHGAPLGVGWVSGWIPGHGPLPTSNCTWY
jgi:hypothetical protein